MIGFDSAHQRHAMKISVTVLFLITTSAWAIDTTITADRDNTLYESPTGDISNGSGDYLFVGRTNQAPGSHIRRGLLHFDVAGSIPVGATITDVSLTLNMNKSRGFTQTVSLHNLTSDWGEGSSNAPGNEGGGTTAQTGDATWTNNFFGSSLWLSPGGDFNAVASASQTVVNTGQVVFSSNNLISDVQNWLDNPVTNRGWILIGDETTNATAQRFASREFANSNDRPTLSVSYELTSTLQFNPVKDNTLYESNTGTSSNGAGDRMFIGLTNQATPTRRAVLEFDLSSIHPAATITDVQLDLTISDIPVSVFVGTVNAQLHMATAEWGEANSTGSGSGGPAASGDATWLHRFFDTDAWSTPGGDFMPSPSASAAFDDMSTEIQFSSTPDLIADVTTWIQDANNNHGWVVLGDEVNGGNARGVYSREGTTPPVLTVTFTAPPDLIFADGFE